MTFREKSITRLYAFAMAAVFALVLAGCGGGGGTATAPDPDPPAMPDPTPQEMCEADGGRYNADGSCTSADDLAEEMALSGAQEAAMAAYMAAMAAVGGAKDPVAMSKAQMYADAAKTASDAAAMATTSAMAMEYQMAAEGHRDMAMKAAGEPGLELTMLANKQLNSEDIANAGLEGDDPPAYRSNASNVGIAMANATNAEDATFVGAAASTTADGTGSGSRTNLGASSNSATAPTSITVPADTNTTAVVMYKAGGSAFMLGFGDITTPANVFQEGETPSRFQTRGGWEAQELVVEGAAGTNARTRLIVSTDIQAPTQNYAATPTRDSADATTTPVVGGVIVAGEVAGDGSNFAVTFNADPADNMPPVAGQFQCNTTGTPCSISVDESGKIVASTGYSFHPSTGITNPDNDYLAWGFWVTGSTVDTLAGTTPDANTAPDAQAGAFAYGSQVFTVEDTHKGTASYNGVANGLYSAGGMVEYFDADASLMANFGGGAESDTAATNVLLGAVTGTISNIRAGGMDVAGSLTLERAEITEATGGVGSSAGFSDDVSGTLAGRAMDGRWYGQFYGSGDHPTTAAGTFAAEAPGHSNDPVRIMGAFGAWKAE
ncbi:MAG: hypothetical protein OXG62_03030 [Nitrospinae bacterium]|nr:hypothetical protein [Nitrospinota bacterium]